MAELPLGFFQFVTKTGDRDVRVGFSQRFNEALGEHGTKIKELMEVVSHFEVNSDAEDLTTVRTELDQLLRQTIGASYEELEGQAEALENELNLTSNPKQAARAKGILWLRRISEDNEE